MRIRHKILAWYLSVFLVFSVWGLLALVNMHRIQLSYSSLIDHRARLVSETKDLMLAVEYEALMLRTYLLTGRDEYQVEFQRQADRVNKILAQLEKGLIGETEKVLFANLKRTVNSFTDVYAQSIVAVRERPGLTEQEKLAEVVRLTVAKRGTVRGVIAQGEDFIAYQQKLMDNAAKYNAERVKSTSATFTVLGFFILLLGIAVALYISWTIADPVRRIEDQVNRIARGDLTSQDLEVASRDEVGQLARSFGNMVVNLRRLTERIQERAKEIGDFSVSLRAKAREAANSSGSTAAVLNRTVAAIGELNDRAQALVSVSERASEQAERIKETTSQVLTQLESTARTATRASKAVRDLSTALTDIRQITEFISQFADQADLLSRKATEELLAESAGKGNEGVFIDLVHEIQTRAQEAARSTKEVTDLITVVQEHTREVVSSVEEDCRLIGKGRSAAREATEAFGALAEEVRTVSARIKETVEASRGFFTALEKVTSASEVQATLVEGVARACDMLDSLVKDLQGTLDTLKL